MKLVFIDCDSRASIGWLVQKGPPPRPVKENSETSETPNSHEKDSACIVVNEGSVGGRVYVGYCGHHKRLSPLDFIVAAASKGLIIHK